MKSYPFDDALKILANVLELDGKKNRRTKKIEESLIMMSFVYPSDLQPRRI